MMNFIIIIINIIRLLGILKSVKFCGYEQYRVQIINHLNDIRKFLVYCILLFIKSNTIISLQKHSW